MADAPAVEETDNEEAAQESQVVDQPDEEDEEEDDEIDAGGDQPDASGGGIIKKKKKKMGKRKMRKTLSNKPQDFQNYVTGALTIYGHTIHSELYYNVNQNSSQTIRN
ncbi:hypothetical protein LOTGIDRAFT_169697 [Lottia gigantea]|uniref:Uncharacterized protein n=1 Tax=Lottia gigantea TaxID=225164 RepID=V3ZKY2_LOTGI|nr:hypothetical protein LOTGIDRAFT_169697 [Lottia gigantea]ESO83060.1 hypothetical protein LOTGIDRAFT_169697 [Lottia gigantea]